MGHDEYPVPHIFFTLAESHFFRQNRLHHPPSNQLTQPQYVPPFPSSNLSFLPAFRIRMFLGLLDPDPSINKQKNEEKP
jgi:hypothetical protein